MAPRGNVRGEALRGSQAGLALTPEQEARLLEARAALLEALRGLAEERRGLLAGLALELLACPRDQWHRCGGLQRLLRSLGQERAAVHTFLFSVCDEIMTPQQEAFLDTESYPWCPDVWGLVGALAAASKGPAGRDLGKVPGLEAGGTAFGPLMPLNTAFQLLKAPLLAKGLGLRLKCGILMDPYLTVVPSSAFPTTSVAQLAGMSIYDVHCGKYRSTQFQEWLHVNLPGHSQLTALIPH